MAGLPSASGLGSQGPQVPNPFPASPQSAASAITDTAPFFDAIGQLLRAQQATLQQLADRSTGDNTQVWSKVLPKPEQFKPKNREDELSMWPEWQWSFKQYVGAISSSMAELLDEVERDPETEMSHLMMADAVVPQSRALYALLASLMKGRPLDIVRSVTESNGFEAYRLLYKTLSPTSKARALALLGAIASYPPFTSGSLLEQILRFEDLHTRYRQASGKDIDEQLTSAILLRSLPPEVKSHVTVNLPEDASYTTLREMLLKWERGTQTWTSSIVSGGTIGSDPNAMEVDQIGQIKGKSKSGKPTWKGARDGSKGDKNGKQWPWTPKGKGHADGKGEKGPKGKNSDWSQKGVWGKSKGKGKPGPKGKGPGGQSDHNQCRLCGQTGHWAKECWMNKQRIQQVGQSGQDAAPSGLPAHAQSQVANSTAAPHHQALQQQQARVKRVVCLLDEPASSTNLPSSYSSTSHCRVVSIFPMDDPMDEWLPEAQPDYEAFDLTYAEWYEECDVECDAMIAAVHEAHDCPSYVQASHLESHAGLDGMYEKMSLS